MLPSPLEIVFNCYCSFFLEKGYVSNIRCRKENLLEDIIKLFVKMKDISAFDKKNV